MSVYIIQAAILLEKRGPCSAHKPLNNRIFCTPATQNNSELTQVHPRDI